MKNVTIQDIAQAAGVSKATVSRVLNGTANVTAEKQQAVQTAIRELGFQPNVAARSLSRGRSMTIGVLTQLIGSPFYDSIAQGVIVGLQKTGYMPIFVDGLWQSDKEIEALRSLQSQRVDGLILVGGSVSEQEIANLCGNLPVVVAARHLQNRTCIYMDNVNGGYLAAKYLIDRGHQRIAIIGGLQHHPDAQDRLTGYRNALEASGLPIDKELILEGDYSPESGMQGIERLLAKQIKFTAVVAANDTNAFGARLALHQNKLRVPEDVSLIGFDDQMEAAFVVPPLTTIRQPAHELGQQATAAMLSMIEGETVATQILEGSLIERESVSSPNHQR